MGANERNMQTDAERIKLLKNYSVSVFSNEGSRHLIDTFQINVHINGNENSAIYYCAPIWYKPNNCNHVPIRPIHIQLLHFHSLDELENNLLTELILHYANCEIKLGL